MSDSFQNLERGCRQIKEQHQFLVFEIRSQEAKRGGRFSAMRNFYDKRSCIEFGKILKNLERFQLRRICVSMNRCCMNPGLIKKVKNL